MFRLWKSRGRVTALTLNGGTGTFYLGPIGPSRALKAVFVLSLLQVLIPSACTVQCTHHSPCRLNGKWRIKQAQQQLAKFFRTDGQVFGNVGNRHVPLSQG